MAIKLLTNKRIIKYDDKNPNFIPQKEEDKKPIIDGNLKEETEDIYVENQKKRHSFQPDNGNLQMTELMTGLINKLDDLKDLGVSISKDAEDAFTKKRSFGAPTGAGVSFEQILEEGLKRIPFL